MRSLAVGALLLAIGASAGAQSREPRSDVDVIVPVPPVEHERLYWFGRRDHHAVPGTVTIDRAPYACDVDRTSFADRDAFVAHLRSAHGVVASDVASLVVVHGGRVHFVGR
jgi:hypothetical protein